MASNYKLLYGIVKKISMEVVKSENSQKKWIIPYSMHVLFAPGAIFYRFDLIEATFYNPGFLFIKRREGETLLSGQPVERIEVMDCNLQTKPSIFS